VSDDTIRFGIDLGGNAKEVAQSTEQALESLQEAIQGDTFALREMQKALRNLQGGNVGDVASIRKLKDGIAAQRVKVAQAQQSWISLGGNFKKLKNPQNDLTKSVKQMLTQVQQASAPVAGLSGKLGALRSVFAAGPLIAGPVLLAVGLIALSAAAVTATAALLAYGLAQADARRSEALHLEGITKIRYWMYGFGTGMRRTADSASYLQRTIDRVSSGVAIGRGEVGKYTEQLYKMGLRGKNLAEALEGASITAAVQGDAQAQLFMNWAAGANMTGQSVKRLADDVRARLGGIARKQMLSLSVQSMKLRENFAALFRDVKIEGFLELLNSVVELFGQGQEVGRAWKTIMEAIFGPFNRDTKATQLTVKRFFQGLTLAALDVVLAVQDVGLWWKRTFGKKAKSDVDWLTMALTAGKFAVYGLAGGLLLAAISLGVLLSPFIAFGLAIYGVARAVEMVLSSLGRLVDAFYEAGGVLARGLVDGLRMGIMGGSSGVVAAMSGLGGRVWAAFKAKLGIASPSRVMFAGGLNTARGAEGGILAGLPRVQRASERMGNAAHEAAAGQLRASWQLGDLTGARVIDLAPRMKQRAAEQRKEAAHSMAAGGGAAPSTQQRREVSAQAGGLHVTIENITIHGADDAAKVADALQPELVRVLRQVAVQMGIKAA
jgi:hypothetical protein